MSTSVPPTYIGLCCFSYLTGDLNGLAAIEPEAVLLLAARGC